MRLSVPALLLLAGCLSSCGTTRAPVISRYPNPPLVVHVAGKYVDDDNPPEYTLRFRNTGAQIVSYDYTVADRPGVPHIDRDGPNSGFIANQYPGSEIEIPNPLKKSRVWVSLGTISYGKKTDLASKKPGAHESPLAQTGGADLIEPSALPQNP